MNKQINQLPYLEKRTVWLDLQDRLTQLFLQPSYQTATDFYIDYYTTVQEMPEYFLNQIHEWADTYNVQDTSTIERMLVTDIQEKRFKLCNHCNQPFISYDAQNISRYCDSTPFKSYSLNSQSYRPNHNKKSYCQEQGQRKVRNKYKERQQHYETLQQGFM